MDQNLDIDKLEAITIKLINSLRKRLDNGVNVKLDADYYWDISLSDAFDMEKAPTQLHCGQLQDDWDFLLKILDDEKQAFPLMFVHLAPIFKYLAAVNNNFIVSEKKEDSK